MLHSTPFSISTPSPSLSASGKASALVEAPSLLDPDVIDDVNDFDAGFGSARAGPGGALATPARNFPFRRLAGGIPFCGNYRGAIWNSQSLFHSKSSKQARKWLRILKLLGHRDFIMISETHSLPGKVKVVETMLSRLGLTAFWSHGTSRRDATE